MKNSEFKYLLIGVLILAWGVITYQRNQKRKTERAEILNDLNSYVNGFIKFAAIQKAIVQNGKGWWISKEEFEKQPGPLKKCALDEKCTWSNGSLGYVGAGLIASTFLTGPLGIQKGAGLLLNQAFSIFPTDTQKFMFAGEDTNQRFPPTVEDIKNAKIVLIGVTEGVSFHAELNKYPGRSVDEFWKQVNKNYFYLNRLKFLEKNPGYSGKMYRKSTLKSIANNYKDLSLNKATEILLNQKKIQDFPG